MFETGVIIGLSWLALVILVTLVGAVFSIAHRRKEKEWESNGTIAFGVGGALTLISFAIAAFALFPYQPKYWQWQPKEGIVAEVKFDSKADQSTKNSNDWDKGGLRITLGDGATFFTTDFHLATKRVGEKVELVCKPSYQQTNIDRLDCKSQVGS